MRYLVRNTMGETTSYASERDRAVMTPNPANAVLLQRGAAEELRSALELTEGGDWDLVPEEEWDVERVAPGGGLPLDWFEEVSKTLGWSS